MIWERFFKKNIEVHKILPIGIDQQPQYSPATFRNNVKEGYAKNEIIYKCIKFKADSCSLLSFDVFDARQKKQENSDLDKLLNQPNPETTQFDFISQILIDLDLAGQAFYEIIRSRSGRPVQLWRLLPDSLKPIETNENGLIGYEFSLHGSANKVFIPKENILAFKLFNPLKKYIGLSPVSVAGRVGDVDNATVDYIKQLFQNGGIPMGFLKTKHNVTKTIADQIKKRWTESYSTTKNWFKIAVLGNDADFVKLGVNINEMAMEKIDEKTISRICMVLGVPPILLGATFGVNRSTFNNYQTARKHFWQDSMLPQLKRIQQVLSLVLGKEFPGYSISVNTDNVSILQDDKKELWSRGGTALVQGAITVNEFREMIGKPTVVGGDVFLRSPMQAEEPATIGKKDLDIPADSVNFTIFDEKKAKSIIAFQLEREKVLKKKVFAYLKKQYQRVLKSSGFPKNKKVKDLFELDWDKEAKDLYTEIYPTLDETAKLTAQKEVTFLVAETGKQISLDLANNEIGKWLDGYAFDMVKDITETTKTFLSDTVSTWIESSEPRSVLVNDIAKQFNEIRAQMISTTETTRATFEGRHSVWETSKLVDKWIWHTTGDDKVDEECFALEGREFPLGSSTRPPYHVNCRCYAEAVLKKIEG